MQGTIFSDGSAVYAKFVLKAARTNFGKIEAQATTGDTMFSKFQGQVETALHSIRHVPKSEFSSRGSQWEKSVG